MKEHIYRQSEGILSASQKRLLLTTMFVANITFEALTYTIDKVKIKNILSKIPKEGGQRVYSHLPFVQMYDVYREKGLVSGTPIPKGSLGSLGRYCMLLPQSLQVYPPLHKFLQSIQEGNELIPAVSKSLSIAHYEANDAYIFSLGILLGQIFYYGMVATGDAKQIYTQSLHNPTSPQCPSNLVEVLDGA